MNLSLETYYILTGLNVWNMLNVAGSVWGQLSLTHRTCTLIQHHSAPSYNHVNPSLLVEFRSIILIRLNGPCGRRIKRIDNFSKLGISCLSKGMEWKQVRDTLQTATFTKSRFKSHTNSVFLHDRKRPADTFGVYELHSLFVLKLPLRTPEMKSHSPLSFVFFFFNQWTSNRCFSILFVFFCCCCCFFFHKHIGLHFKTAPISYPESSGFLVSGVMADQKARRLWVQDWNSTWILCLGLNYKIITTTV